MSYFMKSAILNGKIWEAYNIIHNIPVSKTIKFLPSLTSIIYISKFLPYNNKCESSNYIYDQQTNFDQEILHDFLNYSSQVPLSPRPSYTQRLIALCQGHLYSRRTAVHAVRRRHRPVLIDEQTATDVRASRRPLQRPLVRPRMRLCVTAVDNKPCRSVR